jgi:hypothetical protein
MQLTVLLPTEKTGSGVPLARKNWREGEKLNEMLNAQPAQGQRAE